MTANTDPRTPDVASGPQSSNRLMPQPPGAAVLSLPREPHAKPQETAVAVNPRDPDNLIISYHEAIGEGGDHHPNVDVRLNVAYSFDAGRTWAVAGNTTHPDYHRSLDATVAFDARGTAYLAYLGFDTTDFFDPMTTRHGQFVARSLDGGRTWEQPIPLAERPRSAEHVFEHCPHIAVDDHVRSPFYGSVYIVWDRQFGWDADAWSRGLFASAGHEDTLVVRSNDGGQTWSEPQLIANHDCMVGTSMAAVVGADGRLYVAAAEGTDEGEWSIKLYTSSDGGETFIPAGVIEQHSGGGLSLGIDSSCEPNRLFAAWTSQRHGDRDIFVTTSDDAGASWLPSVRVNDDERGNGADQFMQALTVDRSDGAVYLMFYDRRRGQVGPKLTVTLARSVDGGRTFENYAWSEAHFDPTLARLGDYVGIAAVDGHVVAAWMENAVDDTADVSPERAAELAETQEWKESAYSTWPFGPSVIKVGLADFEDSGV